MDSDYFQNSLFATLSHGSQEVVHSDFLYFLAKNQPLFFKAVISEVGLDSDYADINREFKNMDLCFFKERETSPYLVIENKVKSLPTDEQIKKYQEKFPDAKFVFLSLFGENLNLKTPLITYARFIDAIDKHISMLNNGGCAGCLTYLFTRDYISSIRSMSSYIKEFVTDSAALKKYTVKEYFHFDPDIHKELQVDRLEGIIKKLRMSALHLELKNKLLQSEIGPDIKKAIDDGIITFGHGISNSKPLIDCWIYTGLKKDGKFRYFIQFDNGYLNHGIYVNTEEGRKISLYKKDNKSEKNIQKQKVAASLLSEVELKPLSDLCNALNPTEPSKIRSYNNMFYVKAIDLEADEIFNKNLSEALDIMTEIIITTYKNLLTNNITSNEEKL